MQKDKDMQPGSETGNADDATPESSESDGATINLPRFINASYTDAKGKIHSDKLDTTKLTPDRIAKLISRGRFAEMAKGDINEAIETKVRMAVSEYSAETKQQVEQMLAALKKEPEAKLDLEAINQGDTSSIAAYLKDRERRINELEEKIRSVEKAKKDKEEEEALTKKLFEAYNSEIIKAKELYDWPEEIARKFAAKIQHLELTSEKVADFAEDFNKIVVKEAEAADDADKKKKGKDAMPAGPEGAPGEPTKGENEVAKDYFSLGAMEREAKEKLKVMRGK